MFHMKLRKHEDAPGDGDASGSSGNGAGADNGTANWSDALPENIRGWDEVKNSETPEKFWDQVSNMRSFLGQSIRIPTDDASNEDRQAFYQKIVDKVPGVMIRPNENDSDAMTALYRQMGQPEKLDDYQFPQIDVPEGIPVDKKAMEDFRDIAFKHNLTQKQFEGVLKDYNEGQLQQIIQQRGKQHEEMQALRGEWGYAFDENMEKADKVRQSFLGDDLTSLDGLPPGIIKGLAQIADQFGSEGNSLITEEGHQGIMTPEMAKQQVNDIMGNREHAYWNASDPGHQDAVNKVLKLMKLANPKSSTDINDLRAGHNLEIG